MTACNCAHTKAATADLRHALSTGDFTAVACCVGLHWMNGAIAARALAKTGDLPHGLTHDTSVQMLHLAATAIGLGSSPEVHLSHRDGKFRSRIDLVIYRPGHHCAGHALMLVEFKPVISSRYQMGRAIEQVRRYGDRWSDTHGRRPRTAVVAHRADEWLDDTDDVEVGTPAQFLRELRLLATTVAVGEAVAA